MSDIILADRRHGTAFPTSGDIVFSDFPGLVVLDRVNNVVSGAKVLKSGGNLVVSLTDHLTTTLSMSTCCLRLAYSDGERLFAVELHSIFLARPGVEIGFLPGFRPAEPSVESENTVPLSPAGSEVFYKLAELIVKKLSLTRERFDSLLVSTPGHFVEDFGADSLDKVELVMEIENAFVLEIPDVDAEPIHTFNDALRYVTEKVEARNAKVQA